MKPLRIAIVGASGRMGRALLKLAADDPAFEVVAAVTTDDDSLLGRDAGTVAGRDPIGVALTVKVGTPCDVLIEFTLPSGCVDWANWCAQESVPLVSGTTGLDESQQAALRAAAQQVPIVWAPNMSIGINLMLGIAAELARKLGQDWDIEICETHHRQKVDAPSGTARALLDVVCQGRGSPPEQAAVFGRHGTCGQRPRGQIGVHAIRMGAIVGEHELHFTSPAESLTVCHRAFTRDTFAAGALYAARWLPGRPPGLYGMSDVLG